MKYDFPIEEGLKISDTPGQSQEAETDNPPAPENKKRSVTTVIAYAMLMIAVVSGLLSYSFYKGWL